MSVAPASSRGPWAPSRSTQKHGILDVERVRADFPILSSFSGGKPLAYLDNAATTQKPQAVIDSISHFYAQENANIHRGVYRLSERATELYAGVRKTVARFLNARSPNEIVFTRGTTDSINLVAQSFGRSILRPGDEVLLTEMEHHSNIVPWQLIAEQTGAKLRAIPITDRGELDLESLDSVLTARTRLLSVIHLSNALGTINPVKQLIAEAHLRGIPVLLDGAQSAPHLGVDVQELDCDFLVFSGHKILGPTGVGVLFGREALLEAMPPYQGGGGMISTVSLERSTWAPLPDKFEAGTPMIAQVIGLGAALEYVSRIGVDPIADWEQHLLSYATERLNDVTGLRIVGTAAQKASVLSFVLDGVHAHDVGTILDHDGIAIRAGHHCAQPLMRRLGISGTARASFSFYNTVGEVDRLVDGISRVQKLFA